jgi:hypothetical protein
MVAQIYKEKWMRETKHWMRSPVFLVDLYPVLLLRLQVSYIHDNPIAKFERPACIPKFFTGKTSKNSTMKHTVFSNYQESTLSTFSSQTSNHAQEVHGLDLGYYQS